MSLEPKVTFIIPTVGRDTLIATIQSIANQTCSVWNGIIVFDGVPPTIQISDPRFQIMHIDKMERPPEQINSAGYVRNYGIKFATTEWVAFVDDDDTIRNTYVETFLREISTYDTDVIIFRMLKFDKGEISIKQVLEVIDANKVKIDERTEELCRHMDPDTVVVANTITLFPDSVATDLKKNDVGMSFAVKKQIFDSGIQFNTSHIEDYEFLDTVRQNGYKMMISPYIMYFVRECRYFEDFECNRFFINCQEPN